MGIKRRSGEVKKLEMRIKRRSGEVKKLEMRIKNFKLRITENHEIDKSLNRKIMHYQLSIDLLGRCPKPHILFCLDAKKYAKKIKTASPHRPDSCLFAKRQTTHRLAAVQTACLLPCGTLSAQIGCPDEEMRSGK